jgi:ribosome-associated translation inhibitor RaiA
MTRHVTSQLLGCALLAIVLVQAVRPANAAQERSCDGVATDAKFGAQMARDKATLADAVAAIDSSAANIDAELVKAKRKKLTKAMKDQMKDSFLDGYTEALVHPEDSIDRVANRVALNCLFSKRK